MRPVIIGGKLPVLKKLYQCFIVVFLFKEAGHKCHNLLLEIYVLPKPPITFQPCHANHFLTGITSLISDLSHWCR